MKFSASKALSESFEILTGRFGPMVVISAIFTFVPAVIFMGYMTSVIPGFGDPNPQDPMAAFSMIGQFLGQMAIVFIVYLLIRTVGTLALTLAAGGRPGITIGDAIGEGVRSMLPLLGVYMLLLVGYLVIAMVVALTVGLSVGGALSGRDAPGVGMGLTMLVMFLGLFALIIWLAAKLSLILPVIAIDKERNPINAISRSWSLTRGATLKIVLLYLLGAIAAFVISFIAGLAIGGLAAADPASIGGPGFWISMSINMAISALIGMFFIALIVAIHRQLAGPSTADVTDTFA